MPVAPSAAPRYSAHGGPELEARVARDVRAVTSAVLHALPPLLVRAVVLSGGYGRGEGGVLTESGREEPYNDYDLFVVVRDVPDLALWAVRRRMRSLAAELTSSIGVEVELAVLRTRDLRTMPTTLMACDLQSGHRVVHGPADVLTDIPPIRPDSLPLIEASRLLLNRAALLLLARRILADSPLAAQERERAARYIRKSPLARGDSWLIEVGAYVPGFRRRVERLREVGADPRLVESFTSAVRQRLEGAAAEPAGTLTERLEHEARELTASFASVESKRLGVRLPPWRGYPAAVLADAGPKPWRSRLREARAVGPIRAALPGTPWALCAATLPAALAGEPIGDDPRALLRGVPGRTVEEQWLHLWPLTS